MIFLKKPTWRSGCIGAFMLLMLNNSHAQSAEKATVSDTTKPSSVTTPAVQSTVEKQTIDAVKPTIEPAETAGKAVNAPPAAASKAKTAPIEAAKPTDKVAQAIPIDSAVKLAMTRPLGKMSLGISVGSNAMFGIDLAYKVAPRLAVRLGYNYFAIDMAGVDIANYNLLSVPKGKTAMDIKVDQSNIELLADVSLTKKGGLRFTIGGVYGFKNEYSGTLRYKGTVAINEIVITADDMGYLRTIATTKSKISPYIGFGLGRVVPKRRLNLSMDLGAYFRDSPVIKIEATNLLKRNVENEAVLNRNLAAYQWFPVVNLRLAYKLK